MSERIGFEGGMVLRYAAKGVPACTDALDHLPGQRFLPQIPLHRKSHAAYSRGPNTCT